MMASKKPEPRTGTYYGMPIGNSQGEDGTWLEGEEFAYPSGGFHRRAYCKLESGEMKIIHCSIPDTAWTIPAFYLGRNRKRVKGFLTSDEQGFRFIVNAEHTKAEN